MFPLSTILEGMATGFPDTCNTPTPAGPVPVPYPNIAEFAMADPETAAEKVFAMNMPVMMKGSKVLITQGDEAGTAGGIVSGVFAGEGAFEIGSFTVSVEGKPAAYLTCMMGLNGSNANCPIGVHVEPSQELVTVGP